MDFLKDIKIYWKISLKLGDQPSIINTKYSIAMLLHASAKVLTSLLFALISVSGNFFHRRISPKNFRKSMMMEEAQKYVSVMIVPTGVGATIGGYAGVVLT